MAVRLSALRTGRPLSPRRFMVLISGGSFSICTSTLSAIQPHSHQQRLLCFREFIQAIWRSPCTGGVHSTSPETIQSVPCWCSDIINMAAVKRIGNVNYGNTIADFLFFFSHSTHSHSCLHVSWHVTTIPVLEFSFRSLRGHLFL
jgi:hypothetical protein